MTVLLKGYLSMVTDLTGDQWNEGDVSCSVVRRVALPDSFFVIDGLMQTFITVLDDFGLYPKVIERELNHYLPFLSTTKILSAALTKGLGREEAHEIIKEHAVAAALALRNTDVSENMLLHDLGKDDRFPLTEEELLQAISEIGTGLVQHQIDDITADIKVLKERYPEAEDYIPQPIL